MKRIFAAVLAMCMALCTAGCSAQGDASSEPGSELKTGVYAGSASFTKDEFSMTWNFTVTFQEDGTFTLANDAAEEKGAGTYALTDSCYTMTYSDERTGTFVLQEDGTLNVTSELPYGKASIDPEMVGGLVLTYVGEAGSEADSGEDASEQGDAGESGAFTVAAGTYTASYTKESAMAGTVVYHYTAQIGEDGTFSYSVSFNMGDKAYDGSAASGTYTVDGGKFVFTDSQGNDTEGVVTANNTLVISLMASEMAKEPYEVTFVPAV